MKNKDILHFSGNVKKNEGKKIKELKRDLTINNWVWFVVAVIIVVFAMVVMYDLKQQLQSCQEDSCKKKVIEFCESQGFEFDRVFLEDYNEGRIVQVDCKVRGRESYYVYLVKENCEVIK